MARIHVFQKNAPDPPGRLSHLIEQIDRRGE